MRRSPSSQEPTVTIKSPREIACLRHIGSILGRAYDRMIAAARPGANERDVYRELVLSLIEQGADVRNYRRIGSPSDRRLATIRSASQWSNARRVGADLRQPQECLWRLLRVNISQY